MHMYIPIVQTCSPTNSVLFVSYLGTAMNNWNPTTEYNLAHGLAGGFHVHNFKPCLTQNFPLC
jgi:hypothetical protein